MRLHLSTLLCLNLLVVGLSNAQFTRVATIGDQGGDTIDQRNVTDMIINKFEPIDALFTLGDNCYPYCSDAVMENTVGKYYSRWMYPYSGSYTPKVTDSTNRFYTIAGNHDWGDGSGNYSSNCGGTSVGNLSPYMNYMPVGVQGINKRYYDVVIGNTHFFMMSTDCNEPDGAGSTSVQAQWLQDKIATSTSKWKIVLTHFPPYSSNQHGSTTRTQWPYKQWGIDAVLAGHDHSYERILKDGGFPYIVNGIGGKSLRDFITPYVDGSVVRYKATSGAQLIKTTDTELTMELWAITAPSPTLIDCYTIQKTAQGVTTYVDCRPASSAMSILTNTELSMISDGSSRSVVFKYTNSTNGTPSPAGDWKAAGYDDSNWNQGAAPAGYSTDQVWSQPMIDNRDVGGSYHFRKKICLTQAQYDHIQTNGAQLYFASDNYGKVWLNGNNIWTESVDHEMAYWNTVQAITPTNFRVGVNIIAAEVINTATSSDAGFDLDIRIATALWSTATDGNCGAATPSYSFLTGNQITKYSNSASPTFKHYSSTTVPTGWKTAAFDDGAWGSGPAPMGFGPDLSWSTTLVSNSATGGVYYFRKKICLTQAQIDFIATKGLTLYFMSDNRGAVYINGNTFHSDVSGLDHEISYWNNIVGLSGARAAAMLVVGTNVIAAEVSNTVSSSDAGFDMDFRYESNSAMPSIAFNADCTVFAAASPPPSPSPPSPSPPPPSPSPSPPSPSPPPPSPSPSPPPPPSPSPSPPPPPPAPTSITVPASRLASGISVSSSVSFPGTALTLATTNFPSQMVDFCTATTSSATIIKNALKDTTITKHVWKLEKPSGSLVASTCTATQKQIGAVFSCTPGDTAGTVTSCTCTLMDANCSGKGLKTPTITYSSSKAYYMVMTAKTANQAHSYSMKIA